MPELCTQCKTKPRWSSQTTLCHGCREKTRETVPLKNGTHEMRALVVVTMASLDRLVTKEPMGLYELVEVCRDLTHKPWGNTGVALKELALLDPAGRVHESIRNIVLSATTGEGLDMTLGSPVEEEPATD